MRENDVVGRAGRGGEQDEEEPKSYCRANELSDDEPGHGGRCNAGEGVAEDAADCHGGVRERRRRREPVRCADVSAHGRCGEDAALGGGQREDQQRGVLGAGGDELDQVEQGAVGPVEIVDDQAERLPAGQGFQEAAHRALERALIDRRAGLIGLAVEPDTDDPLLSTEIGFDPYRAKNFDRLVKAWLPVTIAVNSLNRSMGQPDLYPFALTPVTIEKLRFIHDLVHGAAGGFR